VTLGVPKDNDNWPDWGTVNGYITSTASPNFHSYLDWWWMHSNTESAIGGSSQGKVTQCLYQPTVPTDRVSEYIVEDATCSNGQSPVEITDPDECWGAVCWLRNAEKVEECKISSGNAYGACRSSCKDGDPQEDDNTNTKCTISKGRNGDQGDKIWFGSLDSRSGSNQRKIYRCPR